MKQLLGMDKLFVKLICHYVIYVKLNNIVLNPIKTSNKNEEKFLNKIFNIT